MPRVKKFKLTKFKGVKDAAVSDAPLDRIKLPNDMAVFKAVVDDAQGLVDMLKGCGGDVDAFLSQFTAVPERRVDILTGVILVLQEDKGLLREWNRLVEAHNQAKVMIAQNRAFDYIAGYDLPARNSKRKLPVASFVTLARFWLAGHSASETARGRNAANRKEESQGSSRLDQLVKDLQTDDGTTDDATGDTDY